MRLPPSPPGMQAKLLRVLEERASFEHLGGTDTLRMEARIIALTNTDLNKAVSVGRFREDLFFRLNVLAIFVPPLRDRPADISPLASHFLSRLGPVHGRSDASLDPSALKLLESYAWPGNARELKNAIEHALLFAKDSTLRPADFPCGFCRQPKNPQGMGALEVARGHRARSHQGHARANASTKLAAQPKCWALPARRCSRKRKRYGLL